MEKLLLIVVDKSVYSCIISTFLAYKSRYFALLDMKNGEKLKVKI